ncbi:MAG TPA: NfeD family protein [Anaerolineales bacterium]|nr:NfeD family protein [Anaerolineales bacterium]HMV97980.1 NfeD family protein [Anaerolineales bacterium]HMX20378.1 NfeD family protein [Anaerolineales bacterium]HMX75241.1 NfeD family protein [Anaerolineales bacterium]HMZ44170.1 NfeD family protein [Anaerolineales bacterium]
MDFLLDPNVAYLIFLTGIVLVFIAVATPGTGLVEIGALFCFILTGYALYNLSVNWWALVILLLSVVPFIQAIRKPKSFLFLALSILLIVIGSVFLFASDDGSLISVNPVIALISSGLVAVFLWFLFRKAIEAISRRPTHDLETLVGQIGEAKSAIYGDGSVYIAGEMWSARSDSEIPAGSHVRVIRRDGFTLVVEKQ